MKIAITGKGGSGKTTIAVTLAMLFRRKGYNVMIIDADPATNVPIALGIDQELRTVMDSQKEIEEWLNKIDSSEDVIKGLKKISEDFIYEGPNGIKIILMGRVKGAETGCMCSAHTALKALLRYLIFNRDEILIMDMDAGMEHFGRGTVKGVDLIMVVVEPSRKSIEVAKKIYTLARELGTESVISIGNKVHNENETELLKRALTDAGIRFLGAISYDACVNEADIRNIPLINYTESKSLKQIEKISDSLIEVFMDSK